MNPKGVNDLDPKLRETYERIMGTTPGGGSGNKPLETPIKTEEPLHPILQTHPEAQMKSPAQSFINPTSPSPAAPQAPIIKPNDPFRETVPPPAEVIAKIGAVNPDKKRSGLLPIIFLFLIIVFFVAYGVFWVKVFGLI